MTNDNRSNLVDNAVVSRLLGIFLLLVGAGIVLFPWVWVISLSHPPGLELQLFALSIGLIIGGWIIGYGATLTRRDRSYIKYGVSASVIGAVTAVAIVMTAGLR